MQWIVRDTETGAYWDNLWGFVDDNDATTITIFTQQEKEEFDLPMGGEWVEYV